MTLDQIESIAIAVGDFAFDADEPDITGNIEILNLGSLALTIQIVVMRIANNVLK